MASDRAHGIARCTICWDLDDSVYKAAKYTEDGRSKADLAMTTSDFFCKLFESKCPICQVVSEYIWQHDNELLDAWQHNEAAKCELWPSSAGTGRLLLTGSGRLLLDVQVFQHEACAAKQFQDFWKSRNVPSLPHISTFPGDNLTWEFLERCMKECTSSHSACKAQQVTPWYPRRLLNLGDLQEPSRSVTLIETTTEKPEGPFIALSHCWGQSDLVKTTKATLKQSPVVFKMSKLNAVFRDSITVAHRFGIRYLWIDSLCIVQDDPEDWAVQSGLMDQVYGCALFTVAATSSEDGNTPFLGSSVSSDRAEYSAHEIKVTTPEGVMLSAWVRKTSAGLLPGMVHGPLEFRAWAMQERILSVRSMIFTEEEVRWKCLESLGCECTGKFKPYDQDIRTSDAAKPREIWCQLVFDYNQRQLTYTEDKLPAFSGIAARFEPIFKSHYIAGLWRYNLVIDLAWQDIDHVRHNEYQYERDAAPSLGNGIPSWSWASLQARIIWAAESAQPLHSAPYTVHGLPTEDFVEVKAVACEPKTLNEFGQVRRGSFIELRAKAVSARMEMDKYGFALLRRPGHEAVRAILDCRITGSVTRASSEVSDVSTLRRVSVHDDPTELPSRVSGEVICLLLFHGAGIGCALVLGHAGGEPATYQRLGICDWNTADELHDTCQKWMEVPSWEERWEEFAHVSKMTDWFDNVDEETYRLV